MRQDAAIRYAVALPIQRPAEEVPVQRINKDGIRAEMLIISNKYRVTARGQPLMPEQTTIESEAVFCNGANLFLHHEQGHALLILWGQPCAAPFLKNLCRSSAMQVGTKLRPASVLREPAGDLRVGFFQRQGTAAELVVQATVQLPPRFIRAGLWAISLLVYEGIHTSSSCMVPKKRSIGFDWP